MLGPFDYALWVGSFLLEVGVVLCTIYRRAFFRYLSLNIYMLCAALIECGQYACIKKFGIGSYQYFDFYYYTDGLSMILMFAVIIQFYQQVFVEMHVGRYIRGAASLLLAATALFSYLVVREHQGHLTEQFVGEFSQNIYFVGLVLTYLLWGAVLKLRETRTRLVQADPRPWHLFQRGCGNLCPPKPFSGSLADHPALGSGHHRDMAARGLGIHIR